MAASGLRRPSSPESFADQLAAELRQAPTGPPDHQAPEHDHTPHATNTHLDRWCPDWRQWTDPWQEAPRRAS